MVTRIGFGRSQQSPGVVSCRAQESKCVTPLKLSNTRADFKPQILVSGLKSTQRCNDLNRHGNTESRYCNNYPQPPGAASNSQGIQTLVEAEKEAAKIVQKARQYRVDRLKAARTEAAKEIEALKAQKNEEFQQFETEHAGSSDQSFAKITAETETKLAQIQEAFNEHKAAVIERLLSAVTTVEPTLHANVRVGDQA
ncbi:5638_t:CDS:2 [Paraglomus occultum]|uniref:V-type proton ATPase subunit G n=1 Tax=Paraglomus occultum TaxID=144539 RepID=A0A9N8YWW6_9GLOM|nr:5638_t:CDS:2 [Paraglomus occultum]